MAQNPTYQQKLYYTAKVWGFVKYYHSEVSTCQVNWDSVLVRYLPSVKNAVTQNDFNEVLDSMLTAAGPMDIASTAFPDTLAPELKRNRNWGWINDTIFRNDIKVQLDTIKNNFRPHPNCWVHNNNHTNAYTGWLVFPYDSLMADYDFYYTFYPDESNRLLVFFKYWNVINYFNPYNYALDASWDTTLFNYAPQIAGALNNTSFVMTFDRVVSSLNDAHAEGLTVSNTVIFPKRYVPQVLFRYSPTEYLVAKSNISGITPGDALVTIDGLTPQDMEDSLRPYFSVGDSSVFRRYMCRYMLSGNFSSVATLVFRDSTGANYNRSLSRNTSVNHPFFTTYYPNDTLDTVKWTELICGTGYVNMGQLLPSDVPLMYSDLQGTSSIIFDIRNYPNGTAWDIADLMNPTRVCFAKLIMPDVTYPGTYYWYYDSVGVNNNQTPYTGRVILMVNEQSQSHAEYSAMILQTFPNAIIVGSQTAGADGNITYFRVNQDLYSGFTTLGVFYPNGDSTQRIGIVSDSVVFLTAEGLRHGRDEVLEKALEIACNTSIIDSTVNSDISIHVYPNPIEGQVELSINNFSDDRLVIFVCDITGRVVMRNEIANDHDGTTTTTLHFEPLSSGVYFIRVEGSEESRVVKVVKE